MKEPTSEEKQQYLRENILDKNEIDANKFVEFLKEKKVKKEQIYLIGQWRT